MKEITEGAVISVAEVTTHLCNYSHISRTLGDEMAYNI